ncbi:hypothetical protein BGZ93_002647, partial [Podila epicladia]
WKPRERDPPAIDQVQFSSRFLRSYPPKEQPQIHSQPPELSWTTDYDHKYYNATQHEHEQPHSHQAHLPGRKP